MLPTLLFLPVLPTAAASSLLNSTYITPIFKQSRSNIDAHSLASINKSLTLSNQPKGWLSENRWSAIALWDYHHNTTTFYEKFNASQDYYSTHQGQPCYEYNQVALCDCFNDDSGWAALTSLDGYAAYGDEIFLDKAKGVHEFITNHGFINETVLDDGYLKGTHYANNTLQKTCRGMSMYGGVYWQNGYPYNSTNVPKGVSQAAADASISSGSTGLYALLSARLYQLTSDETYKTAALDALAFMDNFMIDPSSGFINGHINGTSCVQATNYVVLQQTADYFTAYGLLFNLTSNSTYLSKARTTIIDAMNTPIWNSEQGVLKSGDNEIRLKSAYMRRLVFVYPYMPEDVKDAIRCYINIQYWGLTQKASNDPNQPLLFGETWDANSTEATGSSQAEAIDLLDAISINPDEAFPDDESKDMPVIQLS